MGERRTQSVSRKLAHLVVLAISSAMVFVAVLGVWQEASRYLDGKRDTLLGTANAFAAATEDALAAEDERGATLALRGIASIPTVQFAELRDLFGRSIASIGSGVRLSGDLNLSDDDRSRTPLGLLTTRTVSVVVPVRRQGRDIGSLELVGDVSDLLARLVDVLLPVAFGTVGAVLIGLAVSLRLQRSITTPLVQLTEVMAGIEANHDYDARVAIDSDDEIGVLAKGFAGMMHEVRERDRRLVAHQDRLEQDIAARTVDLKLAKDDADAANAAKSEFLATMSHEIRTPMNGMLVMAELLAGSNLPERQRRYAEVIARSGQSLVTIINDILDFSKIEAGKLTLEDISFAFSDIVDTVVTLFAERASAKGLDLAAYVAPDCPALITGDPVRLTQVLSNLVNNALKFTETGHVLITADVVDGRLRISVIDTGIGIPAGKMDGLFSAFTQADQTTTRRFGGTGLGLAISKRIVDAMAGDMAVASVEGEGSTFSVTIPVPDGSIENAEPPMLQAPVEVALVGLATATSVCRSLAAAGFGLVSPGSAQAHHVVADTRDLVGRGRNSDALRIVGVAALGDPSGAEALRLGLADVLVRRPIVQAEWREVVARLGDGLPFAAEPVAQGDAEPAGDGRLVGLHILVADDSAVNREVACEALARLGITAEAADCGGAALDAVRSRRFDLVLMDGSMPDLDGYEVTRIQREEEVRAGRARLPIVALTAHVVGPAADLWRAAGMDDVLHKPFSIAGLARVLERNLDLERVRERSAADPRPIAAGADSAANTDDLLDADTLAGLEEMAGSASGHFLDRIVRLFAEGAPPCLTDLRDAVARSDTKAIASSSHKLKSMSLNVGAARLASTLSEIERAALDDDCVPGIETIQALDDCFHRTVEALWRHLEVLKSERLAA